MSSIKKRASNYGREVVNIKILGFTCNVCLGPKCTVCQKLSDTTKEVVGELSIDASIEEVKDILRIVQYPGLKLCCVLNVPALVLNERVVCAGRLPSKDEVEKYIKEALSVNRVLCQREKL
jgi:hypothetical protein